MHDTRQTILEHTLPLVPFDGWSDYTLQEAARRAGVTESSLKKAFPGGVKDCVQFFLTEEDEKLGKSLTGEKLTGLRVPEKIEKIILTRLESWLSKRETIRRTVSFNALPWNNLRSIRMLYHTVDLMWYLAGDNSTDFSFYTRRMTLAGVYSSTLLFWLDDNSEHQQDTAQFMKRRLAGVAAFGRFKKQIASCFS